MWHILSADSNRQPEPGDEVNLSGANPIVLLGSDASPVVLRHALSGLENWSLPMIRGELYGAQCVWSASLTPSGTPAATLMKGERCIATLVMASKEEAKALSALGEIHKLPECIFKTDDEEFESPEVIAPFDGVLDVEGRPRSVASAALRGSAEPMLMIEAADWITQKARKAGLEIYTPADLKQAALDPSKAAVISNALSSLDHQLKLQNPAAG